MPLSWNEIKSRAIAFSKEWEGEQREEAEAKPFLIDFFNVFGISRKRLATFEERVKKLNEGDGYIDLLWKGMLLVEMKSTGKDLEKAYKQAKDYCHGLKEYELPKLILVCDFERFEVYDDEGNATKFSLKEFSKYIQVFAPLAGYQKRVYKEQDPVNITAAERMGKLHDKLKEIGYNGHHLEVYLVRLLFCLFADDTGIFEKSTLLELIENKTNVDGTDLAPMIAQLFQVLNTPENARLRVLDEALAAFPYVNGKLFEETLPVAAFDSEMRKLLLDCCALDWGKISPAIFGSLFQSVIDEKDRRNLGAHYTSEKNILKVITPLFLDELKEEFDNVKHDKKKLTKLHEKISKLKFLDPACGCGNFLIIAYRELRLLELEIVKALLKGQQLTSINDYFLVDVDQFYGIEYEEFPSQIAQVAMWLMDHQMNVEASLQFGEYIKRIPLKKSATIVHGNALRIDWQSLIIQLPWDKEESRYNYIFGNPPFLGHHMQNNDQKNDLHFVLKDIKAAGVMDYVTAWFYKAAEYINFSKTKVAFVSTNSISQGEQVGILWEVLVKKFHIKIHFAHRTFKWSNEAKGNAAVYCVIIGFGNFECNTKKIFEYEDIKGPAHEVIVNHINPYLVEAKDLLILNKSNPICNIPKMMYGNKPTDGGYFILTDNEKIELIKEDFRAEKFIKPFISAKEFINNQKRWCIWLVNADPNEIKECKIVLERINLVKKFRSESIASSTRNYKLHQLFRQVTQPLTDYLLVPRTSSENREYIPIGFFTKDDIISDTCQAVPNATHFHFGIITSKMHMSWVKATCGRLKSDFRYSKDIVYNNFPWPENPTDKQKEAVEKAAEAVLKARAQFPESSLADLYDPNTMPPVLVKAHQVLDKAVDQCYRSQPFTSEGKRIEYLFELYDKYTSGMFVAEKKVKLRKTKSTITNI